MASALAIAFPRLFLAFSSSVNFGLPRGFFGADCEAAGADCKATRADYVVDSTVRARGRFRKALVTSSAAMALAIKDRGSDSEGNGKGKGKVLGGRGRNVIGKGFKPCILSRHWRYPAIVSVSFLLP